MTDPSSDPDLILSLPSAQLLDQGGKVDGRLVYAVGDIHGCYGQLKSLLQKIANDAEKRANGRRPTVIFCGDYVDRGPDSAQVIDSLCWLKRSRPFDVHFLKGNHEAVFSDYISDPQEARAWVRIGGRETLLSYGVTPPALDAPRGDHIRARDDLLTHLPVSHLIFLKNLELMVTIGDYVFVHAGVRTTTPLARQSEEDLLWIREGFVDYRGPLEKIVVHGHTWISHLPDVQEFRIGIDTGAYETGVLTALRIEDKELDFIQAS